MKIKPAPGTPAPTRVKDLMAALKESEARDRRPASELPTKGIAKASASYSTTCELMPGKRIQFHREVLSALEELADDRMATLQELADEAFDDLLKKHGRPVGIRAMLKSSRVKALDKSNVVKIRPRAKE